MSTTESNLAESKLASSKEYREAFVASFLKRYVPFQIRTIRKNRKMSQPALAEAAKISQGVISRAEDPDYGNLTFNTVLRIAAGFDLAFVGKFLRFSEFRKIVDEMSEDAYDLPSFSEECEQEAAAEDKKGVVAKTQTGLQGLANPKAGDDLSWLGNSLEIANRVSAHGQSNEPTTLKQMGMMRQSLPIAEEQWRVTASSPIRESAGTLVISVSDAAVTSESVSNLKVSPAPFNVIHGGRTKRHIRSHRQPRAKKKILHIAKRRNVA